MLARSSASSTRIDSAGDAALDARVVVEVSDIDMADRIVALLKGRQGIEVVVTGSHSGKVVRMLGSGNHSTSSDTRSRRVVIAEKTSDSSLFEAALNGVWAYLDPSSDDLEALVVEAVERVALGNCPVLEKVATDSDSAIALMSALAIRAERAQVVRSNPLSKTEIEILSRIARGQTSREIAKDLVFKVQTVKNRVTAIMNKTNANSRTHAAAIAQANGWIDTHLSKR